MNNLELAITMYFIIGGIVAIPLARRYWRQFRASNNKHNTVLPKFNKLDFNRIVDSFVFLTAWVGFTILYPLHLFLIVIGKEGKI